MQKKAKIFLIFLIIILTALYGFIKMNKPVDLKIVTVKRNSLIRSFKETAKIKSDDEIVITPKYNAKIDYIVKEGDKVSKGDLILKLNNFELSAKKRELTAQIGTLSGQRSMSKVQINDSQLKSLDIAIDLAKQQLAELEADKNRYKELYDSGAVAFTDYDKISRSYDDAKKNLELKENEKKVLLDSAKEKQGTKEYYDSQKQGIDAQIQEIDNNLSYTDVYSPSDAIVTKAGGKVGGYANASTQILELSPSNDIIAICSVLSSDALALKKNQKVTILQKIGEDTYQKSGKILDIGKYAKTKISTLGLEEQRVDVKISIDDMDKIIVGCDIDVIFESLHIDDVLTVSKSSVFEDEKNSYVWKVDMGILKKTKIELGRQSDYDYEVISGIKEGDNIVEDANDIKIKEGIKVKLKNSEE